MRWRSFRGRRGSIAPKGGYRATLLDTSIMNAVAVGDGNVFVTRQLLAFMNDEDDLIGVMGHEVGHVIGGHSRFDAATHSAKSRGDLVLGVFLPSIAAQGRTLAARSSSADSAARRSIPPTSRA